MSCVPLAVAAVYLPAGDVAIDPDRNEEGNTENVVCLSVFSLDAAHGNGQPNGTPMFLYLSLPCNPPSFL